MNGPFRPGPATPAQLERLRELARTPGMPEEMIAFVEQRIEAGLDVNTAYRIIGSLGRRAYKLMHPEAAPRAPAAPRPQRRNARSETASTPEPPSSLL